MSDRIGRWFAAIDRVFAGWTRARSAAAPRRRSQRDDLLFVSVLVATGGWIVFEDLARLADRVISVVERVFVGFALLAITALVLEDLLAREVAPRFGDPYGLLSLDDPTNTAVLLMVLVGFAGASVATRRDQHLAVDVIDRLVTAPAAGVVRRLTRLVSAGLCLLLARASGLAMLTHSQDAFPGVRVSGWLAPLINLAVWLLPGDKYGPPSCKRHGLDAVARAAASCPSVDFPSIESWIDAKYDAGLDPFSMFVFGYVDPGDKLPLWVPLSFLVAVFGVMAVRYTAQALLARAPRPTVSSRSRPAGSSTGRTTADVVLAGALPGALVALVLGLWLGQGMLILTASAVLVVLGAPLFVAVGVGTVACWVVIRNGSAETVVSDMFEATNKSELLSIPLFVLAGNLMTRGTIARRLVDACAMFAAITGSSPVTVIAVGSVMFPMLLREGYPERYSLGVLTTAGSLGIVIPPSIPMIVYAIMVSGADGVGPIDPADLFRAGIGPGLFIAGTLIAYTLFRFWPREPAPRVEVPPTAPQWIGRWSLGLGKAVLLGLPSLALPVVVLGGIYGWFSVDGVPITLTVTEAAAFSVFYALVVELVVYRELRPRALPAVLTESGVQLGGLFLILVIAISLNRFFVFEELPEIAAAFMLDRVHSPLQFLVMANLLLLAVGCVMDILSATLIVAPLLAPIAAQYDIDPIHFAIVFIVNLEIGYLTPPMGINLFVASSVFDRPLLEVIRSVVPFVVLLAFCLAIVTAFPALSLWLVP
ncbi:MAG: TRAP transporter large permease subunit [Myxococcota bacterium]